MTLDNIKCPFCGSKNLLDSCWHLNEGEVPALECAGCYAGAPVSAWAKIKVNGDVEKMRFKAIGDNTDD